MRSLPHRAVAALAAFATLTAACSGADPSGAAALAAVPLRTLDGAAVSLADAGEGTTVVNFWASYCEPCIREMPAIQRVADAHPELRVIGVNVLDDPDRAAELVATTGVRYEIWLDERGDALRAAGVRSLPGTVILDDAEVVYTRLGEITAAELTAAIAELRGAG